MVGWSIVAAVVAIGLALAVLVVVRARGPAERRPSPVPPRPQPVAAATPAKLPPARIVLVAANVPIVEIARVGGGAEPLTSQPLDAPVLVDRFAPLAHEARELMPLPGSTRCRALVRVELARAMREGILPVVLARHPVPVPAGDGIEALPANADRLSDVGLVTWRASSASGVLRLLASLEERIAALDGPALPGSSMRDTVAALRARRGDLVALATDVLRGPPPNGQVRVARGSLEQVVVSTAARTDALMRDMVNGKARGDDAALALRRTAGALLVTVALRAAAVEVRALLEANPDLALTSLVELESLLGRATETVSGQRTGDRSGIDDAVAEVLAHGKEIELALRGVRGRLFAREVSVLFEHTATGTLGRIWLA